MLTFYKTGEYAWRRPCRLSRGDWIRVKIDTNWNALERRTGMLRRLKLKLRALFRSEEMERELDQELRFHFENEIEQNRRRGMSPEQARLAAIRSFGALQQVKEETRDVRGVRLTEAVWQDIRYGLRILLKRPGFAAVGL